jgi:hypothetical protein
LAAVATLYIYQTKKIFKSCTLYIFVQTSRNVLPAAELLCGSGRKILGGVGNTAFLSKERVTFSAVALYERTMFIAKDSSVREKERMAIIPPFFLHNKKMKENLQLLLFYIGSYSID